MYKYLNNYLKRNKYPFHMPGHKRNKKYLNFENDILQYDLTEFSFTDNLHNPQGIIKKLQLRCSEIFGTYESFLMVNGSTGGILASILGTCRDGDKILVLRGCHKSVFSGIIYSNTIPIYIYPKLNEQGLVIGVSIQEIHRILVKYSDIKVVLVTSPTYEGLVLDIKLISKIVHFHNKILIVDEAHGAHFIFHKSFPRSAIENGADIIIQSLHKTLPCFTQSAILHVNSKRVDIELIKKHLSMIQTSSPSYIFMVAIDRCLDIIENGKSLFDKYIDLIHIFRDKVSKFNNIKIVNDYRFDISKLLFYISRNFSGKKIYDILNKDYDIQLELSSNTHILAMTSIADTENGFNMLHKALAEIDKYLNKFDKRILKSIPNYPRSKMKLTPREALGKKGKKISIYNSLGCISLDFVMPYPPGIPLIVPGEIITEDIFELIINLGLKSEINVV